VYEKIDLGFLRGYFGQMKELTDAEIAQNVEAKSNELMAEFYRHRDEIMAETPDDPKLNHRNIFESWAIQKIAGLQCVVLDLVRQVDELRQKRQRR
jgi:hypothetical protein